jgi:ubiquitin carboxyl-terminal hydrolase 4/11/15
MIQINEQMKRFENIDNEHRERIKQHLIMCQCQNQKFTLDECFKNFIHIEKLDDGNKWLCPHCNLKVNAFKKSNIWIPPKIMIIHIKRFIQNGAVGNYTVRKMNNMIEYPVTGFNLNPYMNTYPSKLGNYTYDLIGVSNHIGGLNGGHYFSYVKSITNNKWYCMDDDDVTLIENSNDVITQNAYVLFYKLND